MQAEVPIVPIVIHNATDVAPKNEFVMRPATVRVTVLPPVDTSGWSVRTLASHVRAVRGMFLRTLGQVEEEAETKHAKKPRSEEHTSELQSLMRISYAVFCLKKKNKQEKHTHKTIKK